MLWMDSYNNFDTANIILSACRDESGLFQAN